MNKTWTLGDLVDLDYLLEHDKKTLEEESLRKRDRNFYLEKIQPLLPQKVVEKPFDERSKKLIIRLWLFLMQKSCTISPGKVIDEGFRLLKGVLFLGGVLTGMLVCLSLFSYTGKLPLNISYFLGVILIPQTLLMVFTMAGLVLMAVNPGKGFRLGLYPVLGLLMELAIKRLLKHTMEKISGDKKAVLISTLGMLKRSEKTYGLLFFWPLFVMMQLFGVGFNLGVIASTAGRVAFSDTAFGWQSTLDLSHEFVFKAVSTIALPWSWIFPAGIGFPSLEQIQGTRLILKDGIYNLATQDLVSWWPFILLSVTVYAFLPRVLLLIFGCFSQWRSLNRHRFDQWETGKLVNRLVTPLVSTEAFAPQKVRETPVMERNVNISQEERQDRYLALVHDDIFDLCGLDDFSIIVRQSLNCHVEEIMRTGIDFKCELESIGTLSLEKERPVSGVLLLQEAWLPPIREMLGFIQNIRGVLKAMPLVVVLIGRPAADTIFTPTDPQDMKIWTMKINGLGDPLVHVEALVKQ